MREFTQKTLPNTISQSIGKSYYFKMFYKLLRRNDTLATATGLLISPYNYINPDFRPALNSGLDTGADFSDTNLIGSLSANEFVLQNKFYPNPVN